MANFQQEISMMQPSKHTMHWQELAGW